MDAVVFSLKKQKEVSKTIEKILKPSKNKKFYFKKGSFKLFNYFIKSKQLTPVEAIFLGDKEILIFKNISSIEILNQMWIKSGGKV